jgi:hypothetical protein
MKVLGNERQKNESFKKYRNRLKAEKEYIKSHLKGSYRFVSKTYTPVKGVGGLITRFVPSPGRVYHRTQWNKS